MQENKKTFFNAAEFVPELRKLQEEQPLNLNKLLRVAVKAEEREHGYVPIPARVDRSSLVVTDDSEYWSWETESLKALFRGDKQPPVLGDYPQAYEECFLLLDKHALMMSDIIGDRRDAEMKEIYSTLRRRPDGGSKGFAHDYMWQAAALMLGLKPLSQAEFEAIMARLERSCRTFQMGVTSRNYIATLRNTIGRG